VYVSAIGQVIETGRRRRRRHSEESKAEAVGACQQSGVSIAAVALARGLNASVLHRWVKEAERRRNPIAIRPTMPSVAVESGEGFVPVAMPTNPVEGTIRIKVRRRGGTVSIEWPASVAHECALLLRELMR
jgi:transposase-like protein